MFPLYPDSYGEPSPRTELLLNISPLSPPHGDNLYPDIFDVRVMAGIRRDGWKLLTGANSQRGKLTGKYNDIEFIP